MKGYVKQLTNFSEFSLSSTWDLSIGVIVTDTNVCEGVSGPHVEIVVGGGDHHLSSSTIFTDSFNYL